MPDNINIEAFTERVGDAATAIRLAIFTGLDELADSVSTAMMPLLASMPATYDGTFMMDKTVLDLVDMKTWSAAIEKVHGKINLMKANAAKVLGGTDPVKVKLAMSHHRDVMLWLCTATLLKVIGSKSATKLNSKVKTQIDEAMQFANAEHIELNPTLQARAQDLAKRVEAADKSHIG